MSFYIINPVNLTITVNEPSERNIISEQVNANFKFFFKSFENIKILKISGLKLDNYDEIKNCIVSIKNLEEIILLNCRSIQPALTEDDCLIPANLNVKKISLIKTLTINSINIYNRNVEINFPKLTHLEISGVRGLTPEQPLAAPAPVEAEAEAAAAEALQEFIIRHETVSNININSDEIDFENFITILRLNRYEKISYFAKSSSNLITAENNISLMNAFNRCSKLEAFTITITPHTLLEEIPEGQIQNEETFFLILFNLSIKSLDVFYDGRYSMFTDENWSKILQAIGSNNFIKNLKIYKLFSSSNDKNNFISDNFKINEALVELKLIDNTLLNNNLITNLDEQIKKLSNLKKLIINDNTKVTKYLNNINDITHLSINTATLDGNVEFLKIFDKEFQIFSVESQTNVKSIQKELCNNNLTVLEAFNIEHEQYKSLLFCNRIYSIIIHSNFSNITSERSAGEEINAISRNINFFITNNSLIKIEWINNDILNRASAKSIINFYLKCNKIFLNFKESISEKHTIDELILYNIKKNNDKKYYIGNFGIGKWDFDNISNYLKSASSKQQYMRYLKQTYDIVTYRLRWGGIYEDDDGVLWYQNGLDIPVQKYNKIVYNSLKKFKNFITSYVEGKSHPPFLIFNRADVNRKLGIITYDNPEDTERSKLAQMDLNASTGNVLSQKQKFSDHSVNLIPAIEVQGLFDYIWYQVKT
jgi:hypothetical protein